MVESRRPAPTRMPLGTSCLLLVPIKAKLTDINAAIGVGLSMCACLIAGAVPAVKAARFDAATVLRG